MRKMGKRAAKVAAYIGEASTRPKTLPEKTPLGLRWENLRCPLGFLPEANVPMPASLDDFESQPDELTNPEICAFYRWWDGIAAEDAEEAIDAIWGKKKPKKRRA